MVRKQQARRQSAGKKPAAKQPAQKPPGGPKAGSATAGPSAGAKAPAFNLPRDGGGTVSLADFAGRKLVLYFYPRADTTGLRPMACGRRNRCTAASSSGSCAHPS
jgi:peroxiredoxin Q/BCP